MDLQTAGEYLQLKPSTLASLLGRECVHAVDVGARLRRWRRRDLDTLIERLPAAGFRGSPGLSNDKEEKGTERAIAAVERRALRRRR